jgi:hypothetical protein
MAPAMGDRADEIRSRAAASAETGQRVLVLDNQNTGLAHDRALIRLYCLPTGSSGA